MPGAIEEDARLRDEAVAKRDPVGTEKRNALVDRFKQERSAGSSFALDALMLSEAEVRRLIAGHCNDLYNESSQHSGVSAGPPKKRIMSVIQRLRVLADVLPDYDADAP